MNINVAGTTSPPRPPPSQSQQLLARAPTMASRESNSLCASCDRCRARKTRCDGCRPCASCRQRYMKKHKLSSLDGVDPARFECFYSPAKRRGPVPGHKQKNRRPTKEGGGAAADSGKKRPARRRDQQQQHQQQWQQQQQQQQQQIQASRRDDGSVASSVRTNLTGVTNGTGATAKVRADVAAGLLLGGGAAAPGALLPPLDPGAAAMQRHVLSTLGSLGAGVFPAFSSGAAAANSASALKAAMGGIGGGAGGGGGEGPSSASASDRSRRRQPQDTMATAQNAAQRQLAYIQQLQLQQQLQTQQQRRNMMGGAKAAPVDAQGGSGGSEVLNGNGVQEKEKHYANDQPVSNATRRGSGNGRKSPRGDAGPDDPSTTPQSSSPKPRESLGCTHPRVLRLLPLTDPADARGARLRACHALAAGGILGLPPIPADEEYCRRFDAALEPRQLPRFDVAALQAARLAELAMGAMADPDCYDGGGGEEAAGATARDNSLLLSLADASVLCLRECVEHPVHPSLMFEMARSFFFHAALRAHLDDMRRYFLYRRIFLRHLAQLDVSGRVNVYVIGMCALLSFGPRQGAGFLPRSSCNIGPSVTCESTCATETWG
ncbi:hypothetical protein ACHAWF_018408 [Thalassiosira exigua]